MAELPLARAREIFHAIPTDRRTLLIDEHRLVAHIAAALAQAHAEGRAEVDEVRRLWGEDIDRLGAARVALHEIAEWILPPSGETWDDGRPMSYGAAFGSNGERDYFRNVARRALAGQPSGDAK